VKIYSESFGFTFQVTNESTPQQCGGRNYTVYKDGKVNISELYSLALTAYTAGKKVGIVPSQCVGNRVSVDHMAIHD
jgi:hypothetical protein